MTMCRDCNQDVPTPCRNSNDRAGCYRFNEEPKTAADKCPVCGNPFRGCSECSEVFCGRARIVAIERAAEVERLRAWVAELENGLTGTVADVDDDTDAGEWGGIEWDGRPPIDYFNPGTRVRLVEIRP